MKFLYSEEKIKNYLHHYHLSLSLLIIIAILSVVTFIIFCLLVNDSRLLLFLILGSLSLLVGGWSALSFLFFSIIPNRSKILQCETMIGGIKKEGEGRLTSIGETITLGRRQKVRTLIFEKEGQITELYYEESHGPVPFPVGSSVHFVSSEGFLFAYEGVSHD